MSPEYIDQLADIADPDKLWRLSFSEALALPNDKRRQLETGVALRRYAHHLRDLRRAREARKSWIITPLSENGSAARTIETPPDHAKLREAREAFYGARAKARDSCRDGCAAFQRGDNHCDGGVCSDASDAQDSLLRQCHLSGQMSAAQAVRHADEGELPLADGERHG